MFNLISPGEIYAILLAAFLHVVDTLLSFGM